MKSPKLYPDWPLVVGIVVVAAIALVAGILNTRAHHWAVLCTTTSLSLVVEAILLRTWMMNRWLRRLWKR